MAYYSPYDTHCWYVSLERAKQEAQRSRTPGSWFEIQPYPCLAFKFNNKWLFVVRADFSDIHVEQAGRDLYYHFGWLDEPSSIYWSGQTLEKISDFFRVYVPYYYESAQISYKSTRGMFEIEDSKFIQGVSYMADATEESFYAIRSFHEYEWYLTWGRTRCYWGDAHEKAKALDLELAKSFPTIS